MAADVSGDHPATEGVKRISRGATHEALVDALADVLHVEEDRIRAAGDDLADTASAAEALMVEAASCMSSALRHFFAERDGVDGVQVEVVA